MQTTQNTSASELDKSPSVIKGMFDRIAPKYDFLNHFLSFGLDILWRKRLVREVCKANLNPMPPILDICCGTGDLSLVWRKRLIRSKVKSDSAAQDSTENQRPLVIGLDFSPEMLRLAQKKFDRKNATREIELIEGDALNLPFEDDVFSIATVAFGLRNMSDASAGIAEMKRVCVPGGTVAILEFSAPKLPLVTFFHGLYISRILPIFGRLLSRNEQGAYSFLPESVKAFPEGEKLAEMMRNAGLENVRFIPLSFGTVTIYLGQKPSSSQK